MYRCCGGFLSLMCGSTKPGSGEVKPVRMKPIFDNQADYCKLLADRSWNQRPKNSS
jgi:hypothetical protein